MNKLQLTFICVVCLSLIPVAVGISEEPTKEVPSFPRSQPTPPEKAAGTFRVLHGFEMQLIAAEPLIADPVDVAYDEDGHGYVVEMRDYPFPEEKGAVPTEFPGRVTLIEDENGDGIFDKSYLFADQLSWPTSVACWKGGVFVAAAPDIWYFRDEDGDHRAEVRRRVYTGFSRENVQAIMNGLRWGLDHRIYGAASGNGGTVTTANSSSEKRSAANVTRHDFRFDPATEKFEAIPGGARFGNSFDDWGNRFVCNIRNPVQQVVVAEPYLERNSLFAAPSVVHDVAESGDQIPVYRISPPEAWRVFRAQRWSAERVNFPRSELIGAGFWTSSSGVAIYRGSAYPKEFQGNVFVGEAAGNLAHRQVLTANGMTFTSRRADADAEFVASTDIWFRPVNFVNAPDGTMHVLDMYRETIEHPWSIPDDIKAKLNLQSGNDRGRIYRLAPNGFRAPPQPKLSVATTAQLVAYLENPNAWHRETAQRLLFERQDPAAVSLAKRMIHESSTALGRLHALYALHGQQSLAEKELLAVLDDSEPQLRRHGVQLAEPQLAASASLQERVIQLANDTSPVVRFQVALTLGLLPDGDSSKALASIAVRDSADEWIVAAVLSSCGAKAFAVLDELLHINGITSRVGMARVVRELSYYASSSNKPDRSVEIAELLEKLPHDADSLQFALVTGLGMGLERQKKTFASFTQDHVSAAVQQLNRVRDRAHQVATDSASPVESRLAAIELYRFAGPTEAVGPLSAFLAAREPVPVQLAAVRMLRLWPGSEIAASMSTHWKSCSATSRQEIVEALLSRADWVGILLTALEKDEIAPGQLGITQRARLVNSTVPAVKERAVRLLGPAATSARGEVVRAFLPALKLTPDLARGEVVFRRECLTCHRMGAAGHDVGPNLNSIRHRSAEELLVHIFDPSRDVPPQFIGQTLQLRDGRILTGLITSENDTSLELLRAENARDTIFRRDVEEIISSEKSLMPEGMEQKLSQQDVADLVAYLLKG